MLRDEGLAPTRDRHGCFQMTADGEHGGTVLSQIDRLGNEAARASEIGRSAVDDRHRRIVGAGHDRPVMGDDEIGDAGEPLHRVIVVDHQRLAARIGAGGDQRRGQRPRAPAGVGRASRKRMEEQMMHRRIGQHHADAREPWRDRRREPRTAAHQHDRPSVVRKKAALGHGRRGDPIDRGFVRDHHRERLFLARLATPAVRPRRPRSLRRRSGENRRSPSGRRYGRPLPPRRSFRPDG